MTDKLRGGVAAGGVSISLPLTLRKTTDSTEQTGKVAADMTLSYQRQGGLRVGQAASDLAAVNSAFSAGGVKEVDATNMPGIYRGDWPDAAFATGADWVKLTVKVTGCFLWELTVPLAPLNYPSNLKLINDDSPALVNFFRSCSGFIVAQAATGTLSTVEMTTTLAGFADETLTNKQGVFVSGALAGQGFRVRQSKSTSGRLIISQVGAAPANNDFFILY